MKLLIISDYDCTTAYDISVYDTTTRTVAALDKDTTYAYDTFNVLEALCIDNPEFIVAVLNNTPEVVANAEFFINNYDDVILSRDGQLYHIPVDAKTILKKLRLFVKGQQLNEAMDNLTHEQIDTSDYEYDDDYSFLDEDIEVEVRPVIAKKKLTSEEIADLIDEQQNG